MQRTEEEPTAKRCHGQLVSPTFGEQDCKIAAETKDEMTIIGMINGFDGMK